MAATTPTTIAPRRSLGVALAAALSALAVVFFMVSNVTSAAWTTTTSNDGNSWTTGTVSLTDSDAGSAMFTTTDARMVPGAPISKTITVTNASNVQLAVKLYGAGLSDTDALAQYLDLTIGTTSGGTDVYTGTLLDFATKTSYSTGTTARTMPAGGTQTYHFTVTLSAVTPQAMQGKTAGITFVWEGQTL